MLLNINVSFGGLSQSAVSILGAFDGLLKVRRGSLRVALPLVLGNPVVQSGFLGVIE